jgi:hypothetical protein
MVKNENILGELQNWSRFIIVAVLSCVCASSVWCALDGETWGLCVEDLELTNSPFLFLLRLVQRGVCRGSGVGRGTHRAHYMHYSVGIHIKLQHLQHWLHDSPPRYTERACKGLVLSLDTPGQGAGKFNNA